MVLESFEFSLNRSKFMIPVKFLKIRGVFLSVLSFNMVKVSLFEVFQTLKLFVMRCFVPVLIPGYISPQVYVPSIIFDPLNKLKASSRYMASKMSFVMVVDLALNAPSCR